jgi:predicted dehydrogenase
MALGKIKVGIIGGGMMSQVGHLPFYLKNPRCELARLAESRPSLVAALSRVLGEERVVPNHESLLGADDIDAIVVSVPRSAAGPVTLAALEAGKHVLTEKPMAHTVEQAQRLVDAAAARGLVYAVGYMKRYDPGVQAAKAVFDEVQGDGRLGRLLLARFFDFSNAYAKAPPSHTRPSESRTQRFNAWPTHPDWLSESLRARYDWFMNAASHDVNLMRYFFPDKVEVLSACCRGEVGIAATLDTGVLVLLEITKTVAGRWLEGAEFVFERGRIVLNIPSPMDVEGVSEVAIDDEARGLKAVSLPTGRGWSFAHQAEGFIGALTGGPPPLTPGTEGLADIQLTERIWQKIAAET